MSTAPAPLAFNLNAIQSFAHFEKSPHTLITLVTHNHRHFIKKFEQNINLNLIKKWLGKW